MAPFVHFGRDPATWLWEPFGQQGCAIASSDGMVSRRDGDRLVGETSNAGQTARFMLLAAAAWVAGLLGSMIILGNGLDWPATFAVVAVPVAFALQYARLTVSIDGQTVEVRQAGFLARARHFREPLDAYAGIAHLERDIEPPFSRRPVRHHILALLHPDPEKTVPLWFSRVGHRAPAEAAAYAGFLGLPLLPSERAEAMLARGRLGARLPAPGAAAAPRPASGPA